MVVVRIGHELQAHYVDSFGFKELENFGEVHRETPQQENILEVKQMTDKIKKIVGEEHFNEFLDVASFNYPPDSWGDWEDEITDMAQLCSMWHNDKTVLEAREIAETIPHIEFMKTARYGIETPSQYNNVISGLPKWNHYDSTDSLLHYAKKVVDKYSDELADIKNKTANSQKAKSEKKPSVLGAIEEIKKNSPQQSNSKPNKKGVEL